MNQVVTPIDLEHPRTIRAVIEELNERMKPLLQSMDAEGFSWPWWNEKEPDHDDRMVMPKRWYYLSVYAVRGNSEAHCVHFDLIIPPLDGERTCRLHTVGFMKVWGGWNAAFRIANAATLILHE